MTGYKIYVKTMDRIFAGTDANVKFQMIDTSGNASDIIFLDHLFSNEFEKGQTDTFDISVGAEFGSPKEISIERDSCGPADNWFLQIISLERLTDKDEYHFPVHRWIKAEKKYRIPLNNCCLPHKDEYPVEREAEINEKRGIYHYEVKYVGLPNQIAELPADEKFSVVAGVKLLELKAELALKTRIVSWTSDPWESIYDMQNVYGCGLEAPQSLPFWRDDRWFGLQRLQGINPTVIQLCNAVPEKLGLDVKVVEGFLEGHSLDDAISRKKIFIADLKILEGIWHIDSTKLCSPIALFYLNKQNHLMPIAIQLFQKKAEDNPVFYPSNPANKWLLAKMFYNNAEAQVHQFKNHLGLTHLLMEGIAVCTHRNLSPNHPIFKLMAPHFLYLLAINALGVPLLLAPGGYVDRIMTVASNGGVQLIRKVFKEFNMKEQGMIRTEMKSRGVYSRRTLPYYPYRDDALALCDIIDKYVEEIVYYYYDSDEAVHSDPEIKAWRQEMTRSRSESGLGIRGVPGDDDIGFTERQQLIDVVSFVIFTCSVGHASINYQQYDTYGFPPNYPAVMFGDPPTTTDDISEDDILQLLPDKETTLEIMSIAKILSYMGTKPLGDFEVSYLYDRFCLSTVEGFRAELKELSEVIEDKNNYRQRSYPWLNPRNIPNSISS